jgi:hypothetical protein
MGKKGDAIKAGAAVALVVAQMANPAEACEDVAVTECPTLPPEQHHVHGRELEMLPPVRATADVRPTVMSPPMGSRMLMVGPSAWEYEQAHERAVQTAIRMMQRRAGLDLQFDLH